ncbi:MAG: hypothetical protein IKA85_04015 [Clostridia bacterium]|nr:hypothetical protein [Clostridia bacterium]
MGIPVVVIRGILESGKTRFIIDSLKNGDFGDLGKTLIFAEEQGEEEYNEEELKKCKANVVYLDSKEDFNDKFINEKVREFKPHVIFIEANEMWDIDQMQTPPYFDVQQVMTIIDGTTFTAYFNNMRQKFNDMIKASDIVIINRCKPTPETSSFKRSVKLINPQVAVLALDDDNKELKLESDLPYSLKEDIISISLEDFGVFYIDTFESKDRYEGRIVEFDCMAVFDRKLPKKSFIAGRLAMTCCVDDIQLIGHLVAYKGDVSLKNKSWIHLKAAIHYMKFKGNPEEQVVFDALEITPIETPDDERALLTLN